MPNDLNLSTSRCLSVSDNPQLNHYLPTTIHVNLPYTTRLPLIKATGNSKGNSRQFPDIVMCWIQGGNSREFVRFRRKLRGIHRSFVFCLIFVADHDIFSVLTHSITQAYRLFWAKPSVTSLIGPTFSVSRFEDLPNIDIETSLNRMPIAVANLRHAKPHFDILRGLTVARSLSSYLAASASMHAQLACF